MTDHSKPIRWECPVTNFPDGCIPVYPIIPEGERPEAEEPDGEAYCVSGGVRGILVVRRGLALILDASCVADGVLP